MASRRSPVTDTNQRPSTRFSKDGRTVFVTLEVDRRTYEFCRWWAVAHYGRLDGRKYPNFTAEDQLQGYLYAAMIRAMDHPPADFEAKWPLSPLPEPAATHASDLDDGFPF